MKPAWYAAVGCLLALVAGREVCRGQEAASAPASQAAPSDPQRLNDLLALIEGQNSPQARRTGARELLRQEWPQTPQRLATVLRGSDTAAKVAVALALSDLPQYLDGTYIEPLLAMLADADERARRAAAHALAAYRDGGVIQRLRALATDAQQNPRGRLAAIETLGLMPHRTATEGLVELLADPNDAISRSALATLEQATALSFDGDVGAARAWWDRNRDVPLTEWQRQQIERLVAQVRAQREQRHALETRLAKALRDTYLRTPEAERPALLSSYLTDASPIVRLLGLEVVRSHLAEGKTLPAETVADVRALLADPGSAVRAAAVQAVSSLRDATDAERFNQMLTSESNDQVRQALINGLGYVGSSASSAQLLVLLREPHGPCVSEAVTALGRLAERGVLDAERRRAVATALLEKQRDAERGDSGLRERLLWAMGRLADPRCGRLFAEALDARQPVTVRQAAVQGIAVLANAPVPPPDEGATLPASSPANGEALAILSREALADALVPATHDADVGVRKTAVETLAELASSDAHVQALWERLPASRESDEAIRELAWRGVMRVLSSRPSEQAESWLARWSENGNLAPQRELELLQLAEQALASQPKKRAALGRLRARIAASQGQLGRADDALATYQKAFADLHAAGASEIVPVAVELLRFALLNGRYDEQVAAALAAANPPLDGKALWEGIRAEIERRVRPDAVDQAIAMLAALQAHPPTSLPADVAQAIDALLRQARELKTAPPTPASQPGSRPVSQPSGDGGKNP